MPAKKHDNEQLSPQEKDTYFQFKTLSIPLPENSGENIDGMAFSESSINSTERVYNGVDRISDLPDSILCFILSFLQTTDAVRTCVQSRRWRSIWTDVPILNFNSIPYVLQSEKEFYGQFVNMTMLHHKAQSLDKFNLIWDGNVMPSNLAAWLSTAIAKNVREFHIIFSNNVLFMPLPDTLFTCRSLERLVLEGKFLVHVPSFVSLPRLHYIKISDNYESSGSVARLINGCPKLKYAFFESEEFGESEVISISSPTLEHLRIIPRARKLEIDAPLLHCLYICDDGRMDLTLECRMSDVVKVFLETEIYEVLEVSDLPVDLSSWVVKLAQALHCTKDLTLGENVLAFFHAASYLGVKYLHLTKLTVIDGDWNCKWLLKFLEGCMNLEVLCIDGLSYLGDNWSPIWKHDQVPKCFGSRLQKISISPFGGSKNELKMIKYVLKHVRILKRLELYYHADLDGSKADVASKISKFSRRKSAACEILVFDACDSSTALLHITSAFL